MGSIKKGDICIILILMIICVTISVLCFFFLPEDEFPDHVIIPSVNLNYSLLKSSSVPITNENERFTFKKYYTGAEENLIVYITELNSTRSIVEVSFKNKAKYLSLISSQGKNYRSVPITKLENANNFRISKGGLDLINPTTFYIDYPEDLTNFSLKIGWNSVIIDANADSSGLFIPPAENIVVCPSGTLWVISTDSGDDIHVYNSTNNGSTWNNIEVSEGSYSNPTIVCDKNNVVSIAYIQEDGSPNLYVRNSSDNFTTETEVESIAGGYYVDYFAMVVDDNSRISYCIINSNDELVYINSTSYGSTNGIELADASDDADMCDIQVNSSNNVYIVSCGSDQGDVDIYSEHEGFSRNSNAQSHYMSVSQSISLVVVDENIYVTNVDVSPDLWFCNSTQDNLGGFSCKEIDSSDSHKPTIVATDNNHLHIFYHSATSNSILMLANSTNNGSTWTTRQSLMTSVGGYHSVAYSTFPSSNNIKDLMHYVYYKNDLVYANMTVPYTNPNQDLVYPNFSSITENPSDPDNYDNTVTYEFNATIINVNNTAGISFDGTNYSINNATGNVYNFTRIPLGAGSYSYYFWAYGNGSNENYNQSATNTYTINQVSSSIYAYINHQRSNITLNQSMSRWVNCSRQTGDNTIELYVNNTLNATNVSSILDVYYNFTTIGIMNVSCIYPNSQNYTRSYETWFANVSANDEQPPYFSTIPADPSLTYLQGLEVDFDAEDAHGNFNAFDINDTRFSINDTGGLVNNTDLGVGSYKVNISINDTLGNENSTIWTLTINQAIPQGSLASTGGWTINYATGTTISLTENNYGDSDLTYIIYRDGISKGTGETINLSAGSYNYILNTTGGTNYTINSSMDAETLTINKIAALVYAWINGSRSNLSVNLDVFNGFIYLNATNQTGFGEVELHFNESLNDTHPTNANTSLNVSELPAGLYNITAILNESENYTKVYETWWLNITDTDATPPTWTLAFPLRNFTHTVNTNFSQYITATDPSGIDGYVLDDTSAFNINYTTGQITNIITLNTLTTYPLVITVNDTLGNSLSGNFQITVQSDESAATTAEVCEYKHYGYYNTNLVWFREENCI